MDKTRIKVTAFAVGSEYNAVSAVIDGVETSFIIDKDVDVAKFEGKYAFISTDANGAFQLESAKVPKE